MSTPLKTCVLPWRPLLPCQVPEHRQNINDNYAVNDLLEYPELRHPPPGTIVIVVFVDHTNLAIDRDDVNEYIRQPHLV